MHLVAVVRMIEGWYPNPPEQDGSGGSPPGHLATPVSIVCSVCRMEPDEQLPKTLPFPYAFAFAKDARQRMR